MQGQITTYRAVESDQAEGRGHTGNSHCVKDVYKVGDSFIERPGEPLNAVNTSPDGSKAIVYATFPGVPKGGSPRTDQPKPDACPV
jgi:hypothetical protein